MDVTRGILEARVKGGIIIAKRGDGSRTDIVIIDITVQLVEEIYHLGSARVADLGLDVVNLLDIHLPDKPEASVRHLDAPDTRLLQLPVDSIELVPETLVSENQSESGPKPPNNRRRGIH